MFSKIKALLRGTTVFFFLFVTLTNVYPQTKRDLLLGIADKCLDPSTQNYCSTCTIPRTDSTCTAEPQCRTSLEIWSLNSEFTSFRDIKMCGCGPEFIHGLTIPIKPITGVEDPLRPNSIWNYAWNVGATKIPDSEMALVVNPKNKRSQDQLHVHMLRYIPERINEMNAYLAGQINDLNLVWGTAQRYADSKDWKDYGVLVIKSSPSSFSLFVTPFNSEHAFTNYKCNQL